MGIVGNESGKVRQGNLWILVVGKVQMKGGGRGRAKIGGRNLEDTMPFDWEFQTQGIQLII